MKQVHELFAGKGSEEAVLEAAEEGGASGCAITAATRICTWGFILKRRGMMRRRMLKAAKDFAMDYYMGRVAPVHVKMRRWE